MRTQSLTALTLAVLMGFSLASPGMAQSTKLPTDPVGGKPPAGSKVSVDDLDYQVKYQRAFEAVIWSMPAVAKYGLHRGSLAIGAGNNVVMAWSRPSKPWMEALTPNNTTPYALSTTDLREGPVVVEVPKATDKANLFGQIADHWYITIADIGPIGVDKGKGGKILLTPPGYTGKVPPGYIEVKSPSYIVDFAFRSIPTPQGAEQDAYALSKSIKIYYLSELPNPKPTKFIDPTNIRWSTLSYYDERWFDDLYQIISVEPVRERDKVMMGALKTLGIEKGKPFHPDDKTTRAMRQAAIDAYYYMQHRYLTVEPEELWWPDRRWRDVFYSDANKGFSWDLDGMLDYDNRSVHPWFTAIYFPNKVAPRPATMYLATARDKDGNLFEAGKTYSLTVPKDVPVKQFWSLTVYDMETWAFIYTPEERPGLSSREIPKMTKNADGSVTLYVGPRAPKGYENNWIPTAGKRPYLMFRFYGPKEAFYNKSFKLPDVELVGSLPRTSSAGAKAGTGPQAVTIRDAWQGDYPVRDLGRLPVGQRDARVGYIGDAKTFASVWQAFKPGKAIPAVDFERQLAVFSRNTRYYNRTRIVKVNLQDGVVEVLAAETMSALPIEDKVAMALAIVPRDGIKAMQTGDGQLAIAGVHLPRMKMTTDIPESITAPDSVNTSIGTLEYFDGVPTRATVETVYDYLDRSRAVEAFMNCIPAMSMYAIRDGQQSVGADASHKVCIFDTLMDSTSLFLTGNTSTMYALGFLDLEKDGPTVIDLPPRMLGILDDMAFLYMTDLGVAGPDKGKGGKFLVLPPGYRGDVPDGYFVVPSKTNGVWLFMRGYLDKGIKAASDNIRDNLKVYPLAMESRPPQMEFINISGRQMNTVLPNDYAFYEKMHTLIQQEPDDYLGPEIKGQLAAIGIEKGKPFKPDARMKKILADAAAIGNAAARAISYSPRYPGQFIYDKNSAWVMGYADKDTTYTRNGARNLDARVFFHFGYICVSPAMAVTVAGKGSDYAMAAVDSNKMTLDGSKTYKLRLPPNPPAKDFWAVTMYDTQTRSQLQTDQQFPTLGSQDDGIKKNPDGSYDIYFAPEPPEGKKGNWLQTIPGKSWFIALRIYGPLQSWIDQTWRPEEIELVK